MPCSELVAQLCRPEAYPHPVGEIVLRETHISWVFLTGEWAYKVKKPRALGFLDFSTLAARRHFCEEELRLNRRFAPELYVAVVAIAGPAPLRLGGTGEAVEYAVKMRQFDDRQLLAHLAARGELEPGLVRALARKLAATHRALPAAPPDAAGDLAALMAQNVAQIDPYPLDGAARRSLAAIDDWFAGQLVRLGPLLGRRAEAGRVRECHGDLHLGNIALIDGAPCFFDCIEFDPAFRTMDTAAEFAFLVMDCRSRGLDEPSVQLLNDYLEYSGDYEALALIDLFACYYAVVRAKVALLAAPPGAAMPEGPQGVAFGRYLALAEAYTRPRRRFLAITSGVSGSGKSTLSLKLAGLTGAIRLRSDVERKRLFGLAPEASSGSGAGDGIYTARASERTFARLEELARSALAAGFPCIVDATFLRRAHRDVFARLAAQAGVPYRILHCVADPDTLAARLDHRRRTGGDPSEADEAVLARQWHQVEALSAWETERELRAGPDTRLEALVAGLCGGGPAAS